LTTFSLWRGGAAWLATGPLAILFLAAALLRPAALAPVNRLWFRLGLLLHKLVSPLLMALLFYGVVTPTGLLIRMLGKDPLRLLRDPNASSYWIERKPSGPDGASLRNQF
jgi:hypothetical protein